jgi:hypothetical protein
VKLFMDVDLLDQAAWVLKRPALIVLAHWPLLPEASVSPNLGPRVHYLCTLLLRMVALTAQLSYPAPIAPLRMAPAQRLIGRECVWLTRMRPSMTHHLRARCSSARMMTGQLSNLHGPSSATFRPSVTH